MKTNLISNIIFLLLMAVILFLFLERFEAYVTKTPPNIVVCSQSDDELQCESNNRLKK